MTIPVPTSLAPFMQEYKFSVISPQTHASLLIERALMYGSRAEIRWLFAEYPRTQIVTWIKHFGRERLPHPHIDFWKIVLEIQE